VGHSLGGGVALRFALDIPARLERLVLIAPAALGRGGSPVLRLMSLPGVGELLSRPSRAGTERFFKPGYAVNLVQSWIPALEGVEAKLRRGARVADVGCGLGASTILLAQAYPKSQFFGFDYHAPSVTAARSRAIAA